MVLRVVVFVVNCWLLLLLLLGRAFCCYCRVCSLSLVIRCCLRFVVVCCSLLVIVTGYRWCCNSLFVAGDVCGCCVLLCAVDVVCLRSCFVVCVLLVVR